MRKTVGAGSPKTASSNDSGMMSPLNRLAAGPSSSYSNDKQRSSSSSFYIVVILAVVAVLILFLEPTNSTTFLLNSSAGLFASNDGVRGKDDPIVECQGKTWAVITTILEINDAVRKVAKMFKDQGDGCMLIVGDLKTDHQLWKGLEKEFWVNGDQQRKARHKMGNVVYLSPIQQKKLPYEIIKHTPWNHFGRKSVGMIHAIANGAQLIYDFDDDNHLEVDSLDQALQGMEVKAVETTHHVFNPYPYFKSHSGGTPVHLWPRGFPLQFITDESTHNTEPDAKTTELKIVDAPSLNIQKDLAVIQSLANHDPDVDAIYRMTQKLPVSFAKEPKTLLAMPRHGAFTPWNAQAVLVRHSGFFGLLLPVTVTGRVSDIWRSYITSRLLWETNYRIAFTSPIVTQYRNPHSYMKDFQDEDDLYNKVDLLLATLSGWTSNEFGKLEDAYLDLVALLVQKEILQQQDLDLARAWVKDLKAAKYNWPSITKRQKPFEPRTAPIVDQRDFNT